MTTVARNVDPLDARFYDDPLPTLPDAKSQGLARIGSRIAQMLEEER